MCIEFIEVTVDIYYWQDNCLQFVRVRRGNLPWVLSSLILGAEKARFWPFFALYSGCFSGLCLQQANLEE